MPALRDRKAKPVAIRRAARLRLVLAVRYQTIATTIPTTTTCQTIERKTGSDQERRRRLRGAARGPVKRGSVVVPDIQRVPLFRASSGDRAGSLNGPPAGCHHRIGGAYCRPPLFHRLLMPRGMPIGVMLRSHTYGTRAACS